MTWVVHTQLYQWFVQGRWFSPTSSTTKTVCHDIAGQCSQHEPDGEEDVVKPNVICPEEEDTILLGSSIESADENMLLGKQLLLLLVLNGLGYK
jgi:hypothetical protein